MLPVDQTIQFHLHSPDVIHDFGVPAFLMKMDVIPGRVNHLQVTPTRRGHLAGKCYELCGISHSRMLFNVEVVTQDEYDAYLQDLAGPGLHLGQSPVTGGGEAYTQAGLNEEGNRSDPQDSKPHPRPPRPPTPINRWASSWCGSSPPPTTS